MPVTKNIIGWGIVGLSHLFFFFYQTYTGHLYLNDSHEYLMAAQNLLQYKTLYCGDFNKPIITDLYTFRTIGYPLFLAIIKYFTNHDLVVLFIQNILSIFNIWLVTRILKELKYEWENKLYLPFIFILIPLQLIYANLIMSEILLQNTILLAFFFLIRFNSNTSKTTLFIYYNIALSVGILIKPVMMLIFIPNILTGVYYFMKTKSAKLILFCMIPAFLVIISCTINLKRTGYYNYSSMSYHNLLNYNTYFLLINTVGDQKADSVIEAIYQKSHKATSYKASAEILQSEAVSIILKYKFSYIMLHTRGMVAALIDPGRFDIFNFFNLNESDSRGLLYHGSKSGLTNVVDYLLTIPLWILLVLGLILLSNIFRSGCLLLFVVKKNIDVFLKCWLLLMIGYVIFITGPLGAARFLLPVTPLIVIAVIIGTKSLINKIHSSDVSR